MTIEIEVAGEDKREEWDDIVSQSPHGAIFHQWNWLKITERHTQSTLYPVIGTRNGNPVGIIPLYLKKKGPMRMVFSPPPHASLFYLGPVLVEYDRIKQEKREGNYIEFHKGVENFIQNDLKSSYTSISLTPALQDPRPYTWSGYSTGLHFDYLINLDHRPDYLIQLLSKKQRQNLSRARKRGFLVELGGKEEFEKILDLMDLRYTQQGKKSTSPREYFRDIYKAYKDDFKIFAGIVDGEIVTGSIDFQYKDSHFSWIGNPKPVEPLTPSPNDFLIWESVRFAQEHGFRYYITMNAAGNERLHSYFASKFNPEIKVHFSVKKSTFFMKLLEKGYSYRNIPHHFMRKPAGNG